MKVKYVVYESDKEENDFEKNVRQLITIMMECKCDASLIHDDKTYEFKYEDAIANYHCKEWECKEWVICTRI